MLPPPTAQPRPEISLLLSDIDRDGRVDVIGGAGQLNTDLVRLERGFR